MNRAFNILIIDDCHQVLLQKLDAHNITYVPDCQVPELPKLLPDCEILVLRSKLYLDKNYIDMAPKLKCVVRLGSGLDSIEVEYASKRNITCLNAPEGNRNAVAEHALGLIFSVLGNIRTSADEVDNKQWIRYENQSIELNSLTLGIIGYGHAGSRLAELISIFDTRILVYDRFKNGFGNDRIEEVELSEIQENADIICLHPSLNETSFQMINESFINAMKKPFFLFNLSRGKVVNTISVLRGLNSGKIIGCGLDVLENEKLNTYNSEEAKWLDELISHKRVLVTPHIAGLSENSFKKIAEVAAEKILIWMDGLPLVN